MKNILLLGSKSSSRRMLLEQSHIPFQIVNQDADETKCDWGLPLAKVVESIAQYKMDHLLLPRGERNAQICFVLTADTLSENSQGGIEGKPSSREDAIEKIKIARKGMRTGTAFCLERKIWRDTAWLTEKRIMKYVEAHYEFNVPDQWINTYFEKSVAFQAAGAIAVEEFGSMFFKIVSGSYTAIVGMPMYELREALEELNFFDYALMDQDSV